MIVNLHFERDLVVRDLRKTYTEFTFTFHTAHSTLTSLVRILDISIFPKPWQETLASGTKPSQKVMLGTRLWKSRNQTLQ